MNIHRHAATKKSTTGKKAARKKTARKTAKKTAGKTAKKRASKAAAPAVETRAAGETPSLKKIDPEHRRRMIAETAYFIAEQRGFVGGSPLDDWLQAEVLVDRLLEKEQGEA